jgi:hypothetical protein
VKSIALICLLIAACLGPACSNDKEPAAGTATSQAVPAASPTPVTLTATPSSSALADLSFVYLDRSKGQDAEVYTASFDGANPRKVATITGPSRPLDARGRTLAVAGQDTVSFYDLTNGASRNVQAPGTVSDGRFLDDRTFFYTSSAGCGGLKSSLMRVDMTSLEQRELASLTGNLSIAGIDAASATIAVVPRGCDPAVQTIALYSTADGSKRQDVATPGCGYAAALLPKKMALVSWTLCRGGPNGVQATLYDFSGESVNSTVINGPRGGVNMRQLLFRPGSNEAVFATTSTSGSGPGSTRAGGIWQVNLASTSVSVLVPADGAEQFPIAWTADGRYLLAGRVEAQGVCGYVYADATNKVVKPIASEITFCGANGEVVGWTSLK